MLVAVATFGPDSRDIDVIIFNDNEGALQAATEGYSPNPFMASAIAEFWLLAADFSWNPWFLAVASEANPADPLSRPGTEANDRFGSDRGGSGSSRRLS
eukprot:7884831-Lingulodinium_polyedra.AAC.1